jgi:hypothetical protein
MYMLALVERCRDQETDRLHHPFQKVVGETPRQQKSAIRTFAKQLSWTEPTSSPETARPSS